MPDRSGERSALEGSIAAATSTEGAKGGSPLESERRSHEAFGATRRRVYVEIPSYMERLDAHMRGDGAALAVTGESGSGKSALLAYWSDLYARSNPGAFVITHYIGAASSGGDHLSLLRRIMGEIKERYNLHDAIPVDREEIEHALPHWLGHVQREKLLLVIDALDQLDEDSRSLHWLPDYLQPQVRLLLSTNGGPTLDELRDRPLPELHVRPLTLGERKEVVRRFLGDHMRAFSKEQLRRVSSDAMSANPLFLRTRLEELRHHSARAGANETIDHYLEARDLDDLFQRILARLEREHGERLVREVMSHVWGSRRGLHEKELEEIIGARSEPLGALLEGLEFHLMRREGLLAFFHDHLRRAVWNRYLAALEKDALAGLHLAIARHFSSAPLTSRRVEEEPWQLRQAEAWDALRDCLAALPMFMALAGEETIYQLLSYWVAIGERHDMVDAYMASLASHDAIDDDAMLPILRALGTFFTACGRYDAAEGICRRALALEREPGEAAATLDTLATILYHTARSQEALDLSRRALAIREEMLGPDHPDVARNLADLGAILYAVGSYEEAEMMLKRARALAERSGTDGQQLVAMILNNLGAIKISTGRHGAAIPSIEEARAINARELGEEHPEVASNLVNLAFALQAGSDHIAAERYYREALWISERALGPKHPQLAVIITNLGALYRLIGRLADAEHYFRRALAIREQALGDDNLETLQSMFRLGTIIAMQGKREEAMKLYRRSIEGQEKILGADHPELIRLKEFASAAPGA